MAAKYITQRGWTVFRTITPGVAVTYSDANWKGDQTTTGIDAAKAAGLAAVAIKDLPLRISILRIMVSVLDNDGKLVNPSALTVASISFDMIINVVGGVETIHRVGLSTALSADGTAFASSPGTKLSAGQYAINLQTVAGMPADEFKQIIVQGRII